MKHLVSLSCTEKDLWDDDECFICLLDSVEEANLFKDFLNQKCEELKYNTHYNTAYFQSESKLNEQLISFFETIISNKEVINTIKSSINGCEYFNFCYFDDIEDNISEEIKSIIDKQRKLKLVNDIID
jgi:predicted restriction endonuclease